MLSNFETLLYRTRRAVSFLLAVVLLVTGIQFPAYAESYSTYLDGWKVSCAWSTLSTDYTWDAATDSSKQPKIVVTYRLENAEHDYAAGDIVFDIPGIGNANRASILMASDLASDADDSDWTCSWDQENDIYTFTNKFTVSAGQSVSGGFELLWTLSARDTENGYTQSKSPVFYVTDESGTTNSITMTPLTFTFTSVRDRYRIDLGYSKLEASDWDAANQDYIWYDITTRFDKDWLARGLYRSSYYITVELPDGVDYTDVMITSGSESYSLTEIVNEDGETVYGFYPFENRSGNIGGKGSTYSYTFQIGFLKSAFVQPDGSYGTVTVKGHLNRLYDDESDWVTTAGTNEKVDDEVSFTIEDYGFTWAGYIYNHTKWNTSYENYSTSHNAPSSYSNRLNAINIYNGKVVPFILYGVANRNYASTYSLRSRKANTTGVSQIGQNGNSDTYALVMGDDKLAVFLTDGSIRNLTDDEYDMTYVTVPSDSYGYDYEVFGAYTQDTDFEDYVSIGTGNTSSMKTIQFPDGIKAMYIRVNDIDGSYSYRVTVGVALHLDWDSEQAKAAAGEATVDTEGRIVDFSYLRSLYVDSEGDEVNDCAMETDNYSGSYGSELAVRDQNVYGENLMRAYSNVWLRSPITKLSTSTSLKSFTSAETASGGFFSSAVSTGTISADDEGTLTSFSLYAVLPEGLQFDVEDTAITIAGSGTYVSGEAVSSSDFADHVTYSVGEYNGQPVLIADFDFSDNPLEASATTTVSMSYGVTLAYTDFITYGNSYTVTTYLMAHDDGLDQISGTSIMTDEYDIDGNGSTADKMAYSNSTQTVSDSANEWREYVSKYVKSYYSSTYVTDTVTRLYDGTGDAESVDKSSYSYRLEFGLGSNNAKNIDFFDRIEQGAHIATNEAEGIYTDIPTAWQGTFQSVDTSYAEKMGLIPTVYYSTDADQEFDTTDAGWTTTAPADLSTVKSIWIHLDTSGMENGMMKTKELTYVIINMLAPDDEALVNTDAVNQYYVQYDAYGIASADDFEAHYELPSAETYITLLETVGSITLAKVDGDHVTGTDSEGNTKYASLSGAVFQIYDEKGNALYGDDGVSLNAMNKVNIKNVEFGTYYWEEITAPEGYVKETGLHAFTIDENGGEIVIKNSRIPGSVILTKQDADNTDYGPLADAEFELYTSSGEQVFVDDSYAYSESGTVSRMTTGADGTLTVTNLPWGSYYFVEVTAPEGYELNESKIAFTINRYNLSADIDGLDTEQTASVLLIKKDATDNSITLKDTYYDLYRQTDNEEWDKIYNQIKTNAVGEIQIDDLKFGNYKFVETKAPIGYELAAGEEGEVTFTLDATTVGKVVTISQTDVRKKGSVVLRKMSEEGLALPGAVFDLYYNGEILQSGITSEEIGYTGTITDLEWGDYYFLETSAPKGYSVSTDPISFTVDANNAGTLISITATDERIKGSVQLVKRAEEGEQELLSGAEFSLYTNDGVLVQDNLITDYEGSVTVKDLDWGSYYFEETKAPDGYQVSNDLVRFSINADTCELLQTVTCYDPIGKAQITVNKVINDQNKYYGTPTFIFTISGTDINGQYHSYTQMLTIDENNEGSFTISVPMGIYEINEINVSRYELSEIIPGDNVTVNKDDIAIANVSSEEDASAEVTYSNSIGQYEKTSHVAAALNLIKTAKVATALQVEYTGPDTIELSKNENYTFTEDDLTATIYYDDGTSEIVLFKDLKLDPATITASSGTSGSGYTVTVSYKTESGITYSDAFSVQVVIDALTATFDTGLNVNIAMKFLSNGLSEYYEDSRDYKEEYDSYYKKYCEENGSEDSNIFGEFFDNYLDVSYYDTNITGFVRLPVLDEDNSKAKITISTDDSEADIIAWFDEDTGIIYWYSQADIVYVNSDASYMFYYCAALDDLSGIAEWDVSSVTDMSYMFGHCAALDDLSGIAEWDVSSVTSMSNMFEWCYRLVNLNGIAEWDVSSVTDMDNMFNGCYRLNDLSGLADWDVSSVTDMSYMFDGCTALDDLSGLAEWDVSSVTDMSGMFYVGVKLDDLSALAEWDVSSVTDMSYMFDDCNRLDDLSGLAEWDVSSVTNMSYMFEECYSLVNLNGLADWDVSSVTDMDNMFIHCDALDDISALAEWDVSSVTDMSGMFKECYSLVNLNGLADWDVSSVTDMSHMFYMTNDYHYDTVRLADISALADWDVSSVTDMSGMFYNCKELADISALAEWDVSSVTDMSSMFYNCVKLDDLSTLVEWDVSSVTDMSYMFSWCTALDNISALAEWDVSSVTDMSYMFSWCTALDNISALAEWDVSSVTDMRYMFGGCNSLDDLSALAEWDVSSVTDMRYMFGDCNSLDDLSALADWDVSSVTNMSYMFYYCRNLGNLSGIADWDVSSVTNMSYMFYECDSLDDASAINDWDISNAGSLTKMFCGCPDHPEFSKVSGTWSDDGTFRPN